MISIIIPVLNRQEMSYECIQAVMEHTEDYELVIIDNGSEPPFVPPFTGFNDIRIIRNDQNLGFPVAVNQGIREAKGDVIILLNNDVVVTPGWADHLVDHLEQYAIIAPITNFCAGMQRSVAEPYDNIDELDQVAESIYEGNEGAAESVNFVIGFVMAFRKSLYDEIGPFDGSLWPCSGEEIDFCFKAIEKGHEVGIAFDVYVHHEGSQTFNDMVDEGQFNYAKLCERNDKHLAEKWGADFWGNQARCSKTSIPGENAIRLNLGCGMYQMPGFINVDDRESVKPDLWADAMDLPYEAESVDEIYCGHMLEHLTWEEGQRALKHWLSILKPGGEIRVVVPNFDVLARRYLDNPTPAEMKRLNDYEMYSYVQESQHKYFYSAELLRFAMITAGFINVERMPVDHKYFVENVDWQVGFSGVKG